MQAAPRKMAAAATIVAIGGGCGSLREGSNGFTCVPDNPATLRAEDLTASNTDPHATVPGEGEAKDCPEPRFST